MDYPKSVPGVGLVNGKFIDENPVTGAPGSLIPSDWGNAVTDELLAVIVAGDLVPDEASKVQLLDAIKKLAAKGGTAFGLGKYVDLRNTPYEKGIPSDLFSTGARFGFARGGSEGLAIPAFGAELNRYGSLTVHIPYSDGTGIGAMCRTFEIAGRIFKQFAAAANAWGNWIEVYTTGNLDVSALAAPGLTGHFARNTPPTGWLKANGAAVSRTTYAALFAAIGTTFGAGDGATTFNLPDLRAEFVRGWDDGRGVDAGRLFGSAQAEEVGAHRHPMKYWTWKDGTGTGSHDYTKPYSTTTGTTGEAPNGTGTNTGTENRPRNVALLACIKF